MLKKTLKIVGIVLLVLIVLAFAAPFIFKGKILKIAKTEINKTLNAKTEFSDVDISFFRHFPRVAVALDNLSITGVENFEKDTLIAAKRIDLALNIMSVIKGDEMNIYSVTIDEPRIHAIVNKDGKANWNITKPDTAKVDTSSSPSSFKMKLNKYSINNGYISYKDEQGNMSAEIINLNHEGSGDFTADLFTLATKTDADEVNFNYGGVPYLNRTKTSVDLDIQVDAKNSKYTFKTDKIALNDLKISTEGFFQLVNDSTYGMDIKFNAPSTEFKSILSLIPSIYQTDFNKIKTSGSALFNGFVKGTYGPKQIPAYNLNLEVKDGFFQYPDLPKPVKNINLAVKIDNPDGVTDNTVVDLSKGHIEMDNMPFDFRLLLKKPMTDRYIDAAAKGRLDLSQVTQFVKLDGSTKLAGTVDADIAGKGNLSVIMQQKPGEFSAKGFIDASKIYYSSKDFPQPIQNTSAKIIIDNPDGVPDHTTIQVPTAHVEVGKDYGDLTLSLKNPATDPDFDGTAKIAFNLANVAQFYKFEPGTSLAGNLNANVSFKGKKSYIDKSQYDAIQTAGTLVANNIVYKSKDYPDGVELKTSQLTFNPKNVTVNNLAGNFQKTNFNANGTFDNLVGYAMKDEPLAGTLNVSADKIDLNKWMGTTPTTATDTAAATTSEPFVVPANISFVLNAKADQVKYDKVDYNNVVGTVIIKDQTVTLKNVSTQALDGSIAVDGSYSTKASKKNPAISLTYDVNNLDIQKAFYAFNTVQKIMPIGKFISGKMQSKLTMTGNLGQDMMPNLGTLTGNGNLLLLQGVLSKFAPVDKLASTLNINALQNTSLKDVKAYFDFAGGKVLVKPFKFNVSNIDMEVGGTHGLDQTIDYAINMKVPRSMMGSAANSLINNLSAEAAKKGVPVNVGDVIPLTVHMGGTITNPTIKTDMASGSNSLADEMKQQATNFAKAAADSAKIAVKDSAKAIKNQVITDAKKEITDKLFGKKDSTTTPNTVEDNKKKIEDAGKSVINNLFKKKGS
jgi:hypothetical protein